jgi:glycine/D-amino acid oxidase-like deaminating enzyme
LCAGRAVGAGGGAAHGRVAGVGAGGGLFKSVQADELRTRLAAAAAAAAPVAEHRGGMFTLSPDGRFVAGPVPGPAGLWVASGCNGSGFSSSLAIGEALAAWIARGIVSPGMGALAPARFSALPDSTLISQGLWQYAHYYDPGTDASTAGAPARLPGQD